MAAGTQLVFWTYLSIRAFTDYHHANNKEISTTNHRLFDTIMSKSSSLKWRAGVSLMALSVGTIFTFTAVMYPLRTVSRASFNPSKSTIELSTYTPLGGLRIKEVNLTRIFE
jgi:hypothetical protein